MQAEQGNETRSISTFHMLQRYLNIKQHVPDLVNSELKELLLNSIKLQEMKLIWKSIAELDSATVDLQDQYTTVADARKLIDAIIEKHASKSTCICQRAVIVENESFESAIFKVKKPKEDMLSTTQKSAIRNLQANDQSSKWRSNESDCSNFASRALKQRRLEIVVQSSTQYNDLQFCLATLNLCEHLISHAAFALSERRMAVLPANLGSQMFLDVSFPLRNVSDVHELTKKINEN